MAVQRDEVIRARRERRALDAAVVRGQREDDDLDLVAVVHPDHAGDELAVRVRAEPDAGVAQPQPPRGFVLAGRHHRTRLERRGIRSAPCQQRYLASDKNATQMAAISWQLTAGVGGAQLVGVELCDGAQKVRRQRVHQRLQRQQHLRPFP